MKKDLLKKVDTLVDGTKIRNRSHAIEYAVSQYFNPKIKKALVLAGGEGVKMRPFTYEMPKTMLPVKGKPILEHIIALLRENEIREICLAIGHLGERIREHFGDGTKFGVKITYLEEKRKLGTAGALANALPLLGEEPFVMIWGDVLIDIDLKDLIEFHFEKNALITVALTSVQDPTDYGVVRLHGDTIVEFKEKPRQTPAMSHLVSAGVHIINPEVGKYLKKEFSMIEKDLIPLLIKDSQVKGYLFEGQWFDVGTPEIYQRAIKEWGK